MRHCGKHVPVPTFLRRAAVSNFKMTLFFLTMVHFLSLNVQQKNTARKRLQGECVFIKRIRLHQNRNLHLQCDALCIILSQKYKALLRTV